MRLLNFLALLRPALHAILFKLWLENSFCEVVVWPSPLYVCQKILRIPKRVMPMNDLLFHISSDFKLLRQPEWLDDFRAT